MIKENEPRQQHSTKQHDLARSRNRHTIIKKQSLNAQLTILRQLATSQFRTRSTDGVLGACVHTLWAATTTERRLSVSLCTQDPEISACRFESLNSFPLVKPTAGRWFSRRTRDNARRRQRATTEVTAVMYATDAAPSRDCTGHERRGDFEALGGALWVIFTPWCHAEQCAAWTERTVMHRAGESVLLRCTEYSQPISSSWFFVFSRTSTTQVLTPSYGLMFA